MNPLPMANTTARASHHLAYGDAADLLGSSDISVRTGRGLVPQRGGLQGPAGHVSIPSALSLSEVQGANRSSGQHSARELATSGRQVSALQSSDTRQIPSSGVPQRSAVGSSDLVDWPNVGAPRLSLVPRSDAGPDTYGSGSPSITKQDRLPRDARGDLLAADSDDCARGVQPIRLGTSGWNAGLRSDVDSSSPGAGRIWHGRREASNAVGDLRGIPTPVSAGWVVQGADSDRPINLSLIPLRGPLGPAAHGTEETQGEGSRGVRASDDRSRLDSGVLGLANDGAVPRSVRPVDFIGEEALACYASELQTRNSRKPGAGPFERRQK